MTENLVQKSWKRGFDRKKRGPNRTQIGLDTGAKHFKILNGSVSG